MSVHSGFAGLWFGVPDVCVAEEPEFGARAGVWVRSCCESKKDSASTTIILRKGIDCPPVLLFDAASKFPCLRPAEQRMRPTVHQKLRTQGDLAPELSEGWTGGRTQVNLKRCHRSLNCPAASGYKLRRRGPSWYGPNVMSPGTPVPFTRCRDCSILSLSSTWGRADRHTLLTRIESGAFCLCAEHVRQLGGASPLPNLMEVKG